MPPILLETQNTNYLLYPSNTYGSLQSINTVCNYLQVEYLTDGIAVLEGGTLSNLNTPILPKDAANKEYVDLMVGTSNHPSGPDLSIQYNNNGAFAGSSDLIWTTDNQLVVNGSITVSTGNMDSLFSTNGEILFFTGDTLDFVGGTFDGISSININISNNLSVYNTIQVGTYVDSLLITDSSIYNVIEPVNDYQVANKKYVDSMIGSGAIGPTSAIQFKNSLGGFDGSGSLTWDDFNAKLMVLGNGQFLSDSLITFTNTTDSTSIYDGAMVLSGGAGIQKNLHIGGDCNANSFLTTSDINLKSNIKPISNSIDILNKVNTYSYNKINSSDFEYGFIAQQLEEIGLDNLVKDNSNSKYVNYLQFIPLLVDSIKSLNNQVDELKNKLLTVKLATKPKPKSHLNFSSFDENSYINDNNNSNPNNNTKIKQENYHTPPEVIHNTLKPIKIIDKGIKKRKKNAIILKKT